MTESAPEPPESAAEPAPPAPRLRCPACGADVDVSGPLVACPEQHVWIHADCHAEGLITFCPTIGCRVRLRPQAFVAHPSSTQPISLQLGGEPATTTPRRRSRARLASEPLPPLQTQSSNPLRLIAGVAAAAVVAGAVVFTAGDRYQARRAESIAEALAQPSQAMRQQAIAELSAAGQSVREDLVKLLRSEDMMQRLGAVRAVEAAALTGPSVDAGLEECLDDAQEAVALEALSAFRGVTSRRSPRLVEIAAAPEGSLRRECARVTVSARAAKSREGFADAAHLAAALSSREPELVAVLADRAAESPEVETLALEELGSPGPAWRFPALVLQRVYASRRASPQRLRAIDDMRRAARPQEAPDWLRAYAAAAPQDDIATATIAAAATSGEVGLALAAIEALRTREPERPPALTALVAAVRHHDARVQRAALEALRIAGPDGLQGLKRELEAARRHRDQERLIAVIASFGGADADALLCELVQHANPEISRLAGYAAAPKGGVSVLFALAEARDPNLRLLAAQRLAEAEGPACERALLRLCGDATERVRAAAREALLARFDGIEPAIGALLEAFKGRDEASARGAESALIAWHTRGVAPRLAELLRRADEALAARIIILLGTEMDVEGITALASLLVGSDAAWAAPRLDREAATIQAHAESIARAALGALPSSDGPLVDGFLDLVRRCGLDGRAALKTTLQAGGTRAEVLQRAFERLNLNNQGEPLRTSALPPEADLDAYREASVLQRIAFLEGAARDLELGRAPIFEAALRAADRRERYAASRALDVSDGRGRALLLALLRSPDIAIRKEALRGFARPGQRSDEALRLIAGELADLELSHHNLAASILAEEGSRAVAPILAALRAGPELLSDRCEDVLVRRWELGQAAFSSLLLDPRPELRARAVEALARAAEEGKDLTPLWPLLLQRFDDSVPLIAARARTLAHSLAASPRGWEVLSRSFELGDAREQAAARELLASLSAEEREALARLVNLRRGASAELRRALITGDDPLGWRLREALAAAERSGRIHAAWRVTPRRPTPALRILGLAVDVAEESAWQLTPMMSLSLAPSIETRGQPWVLLCCRGPRPALEASQGALLMSEGGGWTLVAAPLPRGARLTLSTSDALVLIPSLLLLELQGDPEEAFAAWSKGAAPACLDALRASPRRPNARWAPWLSRAPLASLAPAAPELAEALAAPEPAVRAAALNALKGAPRDQRWRLSPVAAALAAGDVPEVAAVARGW